MLDILAGYGKAGLSVQVLCRTGLVMGVTEANVRVALTRLTQQQKIRKSGRGWYVLDEEHHPLHGHIESWATKDRDVRQWNGDWIAINDRDVERSARTPWTRHQRTMDLYGFKQFSPGLHIRPNNLLLSLELVRDQLHQLGLEQEAQVFLAQGFSAAVDKVQRTLWPVAELRETYRKQKEMLAQSTAELRELPVEAAARESLLIGRSVIRQISQDPMLPKELMCGDELRQLIDAMHEYQMLARSLWRQVLAD